MKPIYKEYRDYPKFTEVRTCSKCALTKHYTEFYLYRRTKTHIQIDHLCKPCRREESRDNKYKHLYGISVQELHNKFKETSGKCQICGTQLSLPLYDKQKQKDTVHIDHNHDTGKFRGLLCHHCNIGLGSFRDNSELLQQAIEYLHENNK